MFGLFRLHKKLVYCAAHHAVLAAGALKSLVLILYPFVAIIDRQMTNELMLFLLFLSGQSGD